MIDRIQDCRRLRAPRDLPTSVARTLGNDAAAIRATLVARTVRASLRQGELTLDPEIAEALLNLRSFLFERVYESPPIAAQTAFVRSLFQPIWESFCERPQLFRPVAAVGTLPADLFADTLAAMTDRQVLRLAPEMTARRGSTTLTGDDRSTQ